MKRVLVVCTVHNRQRADAAELHWLLGRLGPDVLFVEHPATNLDSFRDGSCGTLESAAVMRYLTTHDAELVPVDLDPGTYEVPGPELDARFDRMFGRAAELSKRFEVLTSMQIHETHKGGFAYLNSAPGWLHATELRRELQSVVEGAHEPPLTALYDLWVRMNDRRESAMLDGVEGFALRTSFTKGVLLIGAGHRPSLFEKVQRPLFNGHSRVVWEFEWELDELPADSN